MLFPLRLAAGGEWRARIFAELPKKIRQLRGAFVGEHAVPELEAMVEPLVLPDTIERNASAGLGIVAAVDDPPDAGVDERSSAHRTRLEGDVEGHLAQPKASKAMSGGAEGDQLGVRCWILSAFARIAAASDDLTAINGDCTDRHLADSGCSVRFPHGLTHETLIDCVFVFHHRAAILV